jgi:chitin-binding protein
MKRILTILIAVAMAASVALLTPSAALAATDHKPPTTPTNLHVETVSFTWATIAWDASTDNSGWVTYEATIDLPTGPYTQRDLNTSQGFGGLEAGHTYTVSVKAVDFAGNASASVSVQFTTLPRTGPPPTTPTNLRGEYVDGVLTAIAWDPSVFAGGVSYVLYARNSPLTATSQTRVTIHDLVYYDESVNPGGTYTMTVQAWGQDNYLSGFSEPLTVTIPQNVPVR